MVGLSSLGPLYVQSAASSHRYRVAVLPFRCGLNDQIAGVEIGQHQALRRGVDGRDVVERKSAGPVVLEYGDETRPELPSLFLR